jgi:signal transduction histidine kinase
MEERMAVAITIVRSATVFLLGVPLLPHAGQGSGSRWQRTVAAGCMAAGASEAAWMWRRIRHAGSTTDRRLIAGNVGFSLLLMQTLSRGMTPSARSAGMTPYLSTALVSAGVAGLGIGIRPAGVGIPLALAGGWTAAVWPDVSSKLVSDVLGFFIWYGSCVFVGREFRAVAAVADRARAEAEFAWIEASEQRRLADLARERDRLHHEVHDRLLPIVDAVATGRVEDPRLAELARQAAQRARAILMDGRTLPAGSLAGLLADVRDTYITAGLGLSAVLRIDAEPPPEVAQAIAAAAREALSNTLKYAGNQADVTLYAEATTNAVEVLVRDRGAGFDPEAVRPGGGLGHTYPALRQCGGEVEVLSTPGSGTRVRISWPALTAATEQRGTA